MSCIKCGKNLKEYDDHTINLCIQCEMYITNEQLNLLNKLSYTLKEKFIEDLKSIKRKMSDILFTDENINSYIEEWTKNFYKTKYQHK